MTRQSDKNSRGIAQIGMTLYKNSGDSMKFSINELNIFVTDTGKRDGLPVVLIHGFPFSHKMWQPQIEALAPNFRVVAYDIRGFGQSDVGDGQFLLEFFVDDLVALLDFLKIERAVLCGLSMGGYVALRAAERNPEKIRALVLCDTRAEADSNEAKVKRAAAIRAVKTQGVKIFAENFVKSVLAAQTFSENPRLVEEIRAVIESNSPLGICGALLAMASRTDTTAALPKIGAPTLILVGEHDALTPPAVAKTMRERIPNSEWHVISRAAHVSNLENPQEFNAHLLEFLQKIG
jgi:3-oxoadipate enol-lactonase